MCLKNITLVNPGQYDIIFYMNLRTFARKVRTLFTMDLFWAFRYYKKYAVQNFNFCREVRRSRAYWDADIAGVKIKLHFHTRYHQSIARQIHDNRVEPRLVDPWTRYAPNANVVYDIGGFNGLYGLLAAKANPKAEVTIFEPDKTNCDHILENIRINNLTNCKLYQCIVMEKGGRARFSQHGTPGEHVADEGGEGEEVRAVSLADFPPADLIKIDAEGYEVGILRSLHKSGVIVLELHPHFLNRAGDSMEGFEAAVKRGGWRSWYLGARDKEHHFLLF